jgi:hypothetical protein
LREDQVGEAAMTHMRVLRPFGNVLAFYEGRVEGYRYAPERNWVDEGALTLGIASYAILEGDHALVYDTHVSVAHATLIRQAVECEGATRATTGAGFRCTSRLLPAAMSSASSQATPCSRATACAAASAGSSVIAKSASITALDKCCGAWLAVEQER